MAKYKVKTRGYQLIVRAKLTRKEKLDEKQFTLFSGKNIRGLLKAKRLGRNSVLYTGPIGISLAERLKKPIGKYDFLFIMEQIVDIFQKLNANSLAASHVVLDVRHVFINETTKEVLFLYLPLEQAGEETDIFAFMESIIYSVISAQEEDMDYISRFVYFIRSLDTYDGERIERFIKGENKAVVTTIKRHDARKSGFVTDKPTARHNHYSGKDPKTTGLLDNEEATRLADDEEATGLLDNEEVTRLLTDDEEATGLLDNEEATGLLTDDEEATGLLDNEEATGLLGDDEEATGLLGDDEEATGLLQEEAREYASLRRLRTNEIILINTPVFRIGKEKKYSDYVVRDNDKVSRSHADIITRGHRFFIMDLNSTNSTFINDRRIPARQEVEILSGDRLKLADEEFEFRI